MTGTALEHRMDGEDRVFSPSGVAPPASEFADFYTREFPALVRFARTGIDSGPSAEDIASEAMTVVWTRWRDLAVGYDEDEENGHKRLRAFAFGVVKNLMRDLYRQTIRCAPADPGHVAWDNQPVVDPTTARAALLDVLEALTRLPRRQRVVLGMDLFGFTTSEIANELDLQESTTRTHLASARRHVREALEIMSNPRRSQD